MMECDTPVETKMTKAETLALSLFFLALYQQSKGHTKVTLALIAMPTATKDGLEFQCVELISSLGF